MEGIREQHEWALGDINYLARDLQNSTKEMKRITIRKRDIYSDNNGIILDLMEAKLNLNTRE